MVKNLKNRMTLRLDDDTWSFLQRMSERTSLAPSDYIRMMLSTARHSIEQADKITVNAMTKSIERAVGSYDDDKTNSNDKL